ncbi:MAG TPA: hypothetical protein VMF66_05435 [Candidatus Acidoferrum sp.]|nr:hypothetical protein [Candidatus Acidoferrum sp.]
MYRLKHAIYRSDVDPRELAIYTPADIAFFVGIRPSTLNSWIAGRWFPTNRPPDWKEFWPPILEPADPEHGLLSFYNLAEAHVLAAARYEHRVGFKAIRRALNTLNNKYPGVAHPLIYKDFFTDGKDIFLKEVTQTEGSSGEDIGLFSCYPTLVSACFSYPVSVFLLFLCVLDRIGRIFDYSTLKPSFHRAE